MITMLSWGRLRMCTRDPYRARISASLPPAKQWKMSLSKLRSSNTRLLCPTLCGPEARGLRDDAAVHVNEGAAVRRRGNDVQAVPQRLRPQPCAPHPHGRPQDEPRPAAAGLREDLVEVHVEADGEAHRHSRDLLRGVAAAGRHSAAHLPGGNGEHLAVGAQELSACGHRHDAVVDARRRRAQGRGAPRSPARRAPPRGPASRTGRPGAMARSIIGGSGPSRRAWRAASAGA